MNPGDLTALLPLIVASGSAVVVMLAVAVRRNHHLTLALTLAGLAASLAAIVPAWTKAPRAVTALMVADPYALFYTALILSATFVVAMMSYGYLRRHTGRREEYYILLILAATGSTALVWSDHFASFFLAVELLSASLYALVAYRRESLLGIEAGMKYLVLAGLASPFLLFGMALVYMELGTMQLSELARLAAAGKSMGIMAVAGFGMMIVAVGFKLAVVPFHLWTPDVYEGAPAPVTAFIATVSKGGMFALVLRYFTAIHVYRYYPLMLAFTLIAVASMFAGNLLALRQNNVKRMLAYSSIAHLGYLLVAFLAADTAAVSVDKPLAATAATMYLVAYFATTLGAFGVVTMLSGPLRDADDLSDYRGLAWRRPVLAGVMTAMMLSLAGIPLTAGFVGKFYVLTAAMRARLVPLAVILVVNSAIGLCYYLRIVVTLYRTGAAAPMSALPPAADNKLLAGASLAAVTLVVFALGVYPSPMIQMIQSAVSGLLP